MYAQPASNRHNFAAGSSPTESGDRKLRGMAAWVLSDGKAGHLAITLGVAEALGSAAALKPVGRGWPVRLLSPWGEAQARLNAWLAEPWPAIVLAAGRRTIPALRALRRRGGGRIYTVLCQAPRSFGGVADLIWAPEHDGLRGANVVTTLTPPHRFGPARLAALRECIPATIAALPRPRVAILLGGPGAGYRYGAEEAGRLARALRAIAAQGASFLITPSRRTPPELLRAVDEATAARPRILYAGEGDNPYPQFLAHADRFVVTADSVNMAGEAAATGRPIHIFHPAGGRAKFHRYHAALQAHGATRPLGCEALGEDWRYEPLDAAAAIAAEIERRWRDFQARSCALSAP